MARGADTVPVLKQLYTLLLYISSQRRANALFWHHPECHTYYDIREFTMTWMREAH